MPRSGAHLLSDVKTERLEIVCDGCARHGVLSVAGLAKRYGWDMGLPELRLIIARGAGCPKAVDPTGLEHCKVRYANPIQMLELKP